MIDKPLTLLGEDGAVIDGPMFSALIRVVSDDVTISGLAFNVRKWGVMAVQSSGLTLEGCSFTLAEERCRTSSTAMWMEAMKNCVIRDCSFTGLGVCVAGDPLSESSSGKAVLTGLCEVGEDLDYFVSHTIENCTVNGKPLYYITGGKDVVVPEDAGGLIAACCDGITARNLDVSDNSMGLEIVHSQNVVLENVTADRCGVFGTYVAFAEGGRFTNVAVRDTNHGMDTRASSDIIVENCLVLDCEQGIFFSLCTDCVMRDCIVRSCGFGCFAAVGSGLSISNCVFANNADGIYLQNEGMTTIAGCVITGSTVVGLRVLKSKCDAANLSISNNWTGVIVYDAQDVAFKGCAFDSNQCVGLYAAYARDASISGCILSGETPAHFEFDGTFENAQIHDCILSGAEADMVRLKSGNAPLMYENRWGD